MTVLWQDNDLMIVEKLPGQLSEASESPLSLPHILKKEFFLTETPHPVHRLDREVGGALLLAKNASTMASVSRLAAEGGIHKTYLAVTEGIPPAKEDYFQDLLFHDKTRNKTYVVKKERRGVRFAALSYRTVKETDQSGELALCEVTPETGRTHQIRVQFAARHLPLFGDRKYGAKRKDGAFGLWCYQLSFLHPKTGKELLVSAPPPGQFPFSLFI